MTAPKRPARRRKGREPIEVNLCRLRGYWAECRIPGDSPRLFREVLLRPRKKR